MKPYIVTLIILLILCLVVITTNSIGESPSDIPPSSEYKQGYTEGYHKAIQDMEYTHQSDIPPHL